MKKSKYLYLFLGVMLSSPIMAQSTDGDLFTPEMALYAVIGMVFVVGLIILGVAYNVFHIINTIIRNEGEKRAKAEGREYVPEPSLYSKMIQSWTNTVPLEEEKSIELDHEYDGIRELDNHLPPWWLALFYGSIVFGIIYIFGYHFAKIWPLQDEEYRIEEAQAAAVLAANVAAEGTIDESTVEYNDDPLFLAAGKGVYDQSCATCHRLDGGGLVGPNLTDNAWLHGGDIKSIFKTVKFGVPVKGMAAWEKALSPKQISQVVSYIYSLNGSNPEGAKAAEGQIYEREGATVDAVVEVAVDSAEVVNTDGNE